MAFGLRGMAGHAVFTGFGRDEERDKRRDKSETNSLDASAAVNCAVIHHPERQSLSLRCSGARARDAHFDHARAITTDLSASGAQHYAQVVIGTNAVRRN